MSRPAQLDDTAIASWLGEHPWWHLDHGHLVREVATTDYPSSVAIVDAQVNLAESLDHHPIVTVGYRHLRFELWTHDQRGLTQLDVDYAQGLDELIHTRFHDAVIDPAPD